jgi:hypothetical protein
MSVRRRIGMAEVGAPDDELEVSPSTDSKTEQLNIRVRKGQLAFWQDAASEEGITLAAWVKKVCTQRALDVFEKIDEKYGSRKNGKDR